MSANEDKGGAPRQSLDDWRAKAGIPRRACLDLCTPAELAIYDAVAIVEVAGCDVRLTEAIVLLARARDCVADFVDGVSPGTAAPAAPNPSSSTPPAPDLPQEQLRALRAATLEEAARLFDMLDAESRAKIVYGTRRDGSLYEEHQNGLLLPATDAAKRIRALGEGQGNAGDSPPLKAVPIAQRPPDPAAPDLRWLLRELRYWLAAEVVPARRPREAIIARIDAALDEKQVGAAGMEEP